MVQGLGAEDFHLGARGLGLQQRVVDEWRQIPGALGRAEELEEAVVEAGTIPDQAVPLGAAQQLGPFCSRREGGTGADFGGEVEQRIDHGSIMAGQAGTGKADMEKRAEARFS